MNLNKIWLSSPHMGLNEITNVNDAFTSNWIAPLGPYVDLFEKNLSEFTKTKHVAALSSGTAAIHLALILAGVKSNDIVLCQSFTFSASANPIVYQGAIPVFIDSEIDTWNISPEALESAIIKYININKKPKAIIAVHLYGMPAKISEIKHLAEKYEITLIEDAAEALGSTFNGLPCGSFGNFGILSFNGNKIITTSSGGALISNDLEAINKARYLATQARDAAPHYQHSEIGYNYRMSNILAAIGVGQLDVLNDRVNLRRRNFDFYYQQLSNIHGIKFLREPSNTFCNRWLTCILIDPNKINGLTNEDIRKHLEKINIESRPLWKPMHLQPVFETYDYIGGNVSQELFNNGLCLPSGSNLTLDDLQRVVKAIISIINLKGKK
jgi:dTDP-4-amino-4,6-dideoxygalactose transaminase